MAEDRLRRWLRATARDPKRYAVTTAIMLCTLFLLIMTVADLENGTLSARTLHTNLIVWPLVSIAYGIVIYWWQIRQ